MPTNQINEDISATPAIKTTVSRNGGSAGGIILLVNNLTTRLTPESLLQHHVVAVRGTRPTSHTHLSLPKGHVEGEETFLEAARREIYEECGLQCPALAMRSPHAVISLEPRPGRHIRFFLFCVEMHGYDFDCQDVEHLPALCPVDPEIASAAWVPLHSLLASCDPEDCCLLSPDVRHAVTSKLDVVLQVVNADAKHHHLCADRADALPNETPLFVCV
eukprot:gnl/Hemi2/17895_TR5902_c0_g13_i1.p2 gnl/Hemi2/17895_TR5902_c0_g13~~gnl/Hemi2/17895_TR5902_c0_g13_i1.p2  ORF type:complete len:218 (-),score=77.58 gnl/Hemi2/17895_TR5902_c0_g13_i1:5-658(-)